MDETGTVPEAIDDAPEYRESLDDAVTSFMERGADMERDAYGFYEALKDVDTEEIGFCLSDDKRVGVSPDRFVGNDGGLEIKCLSAENHVATIRSLTSPAI